MTTTAHSVVAEGRHADRVALITGAGGGIGRACTERLVAEGGRVMCVDLDVDAARRAADATDSTGAMVDAGPVDVTDPKSCAAAVEAARARFGRIDLLVNAAGVGGLAATGDLPLGDWNHTLQVNLTGVFLMSQRALPALLETRGAIVNIASIAGVRAVPYNAAYCVSKAGVIMLGKTMAAEFGRAGLRVNCVCPSSVDTPFLADFAFPDYVDRSLFARAASIIEGAMSPREVAAAVAYLGSDEAAHITGTALLLDGGATA